MKNKLLYVGMKYDYGDVSRGLSFEDRNFSASLKDFCQLKNWDFKAYDYMQRGMDIGLDAMTQELYDLAASYHPDYLFAVLFDFHRDPHHEVFSRISKLGIATIHWFCDDHWRFDKYSRIIAPHFDFICTTAQSALPKYKQLGLAHKVIKSQWACNHKLYVPYDIAKDIDLSFIGQPHGNRKEVIAAMQQSGLAVQVYGFGWPNRPRLPFHQMIRMFSRSKINLNLSNSSTDSGQQIKGRNFEIPGTRSFQLTGRAENLQDYYIDGKQIVIFDSPGDLVDKAKFYLQHDALRQAIALAGYQRTLKEHTWQQRWQEIFSRIKPKTHSVSSRKPLVSVVIPCYNQAQYLPEAVNSVIGQSYKNWECLIVNDGSTDDTEVVAKKLIKKFSGKRIRLINKNNGGLSSARNTGIEQAKAEYIMPLDADDMLMPEALEKFSGYLQSNSDTAFVYSNHSEFGQSHQVRRKQLLGLDAVKYQNHWAYTTMLRKTMWQALGGYKTCMVLGAEDWEFWVNALEKNFKPGFIDEVLFSYRVRQNSMVAMTNQHIKLVLAQMIILHPGLYSAEEKQMAIGVIEKNSRELFGRFTKSDHTQPVDFWAEYLKNIPQELAARFIANNKQLLQGYLDLIQVQADSVPQIIQVAAKLWHAGHDKKDLVKPLQPQVRRQAVAVLVSIYNQTRFPELVFKAIRKNSGFAHYIIAVNNSTINVGTFKTKMLELGLIDHWLESGCHEHGDGLQKALDLVRQLNFRYICVLDSDALAFKKDWLKIFIQRMQDEKAGLLGPVRIPGGTHVRAAVIHPCCMLLDLLQVDPKFQLDFRSFWPFWDSAGLVTWDCLSNGVKLVKAAHEYKRVCQNMISVVDNAVKHFWYVSRIHTAKSDEVIDGVKVSVRRKIIEEELKGSWVANIDNYLNPRIAVIIPTYNRPKILAQCLEGFCRQSLDKKYFEVVIVDDGSNPPVEDTVSKFKGRLNLNYHYQQNSGLAVARNACIEQAKARFLALHDDDDIPAKDYLERCLKFHLAHPQEEDLLLAWVKPHPKLKKTLLLEWVFAAESGVCAMPAQGTYNYRFFFGGTSSCKRSLFDLGLYDPDYRFGFEDIELALRIDQQKRLKVYSDPGTVSYLIRPPEFNKLFHRGIREGLSHHRFYDTYGSKALESTGPQVLASANIVKELGGKITGILGLIKQIENGQQKPYSQQQVYQYFKLALSYARAKGWMDYTDNHQSGDLIMKYPYLRSLGELDAIAKKYKTDKSSVCHYYTRYYEQYFAALRDLPLRILEIGIDRGGSLATWQEYFLKADIYAIDINPSCKQYANARTHVYIADSSNPKALEEFIRWSKGKFDIIIDDGGHTMQQQISAFEFLFPHVNPGGFFIIEDMHTSYRKEFGAGVHPYYSTMEYLKNLVDDVNFNGKSGCADAAKTINKGNKTDFNYYEQYIETIHFYPSICFIIKRDEYLKP